MNNNNMIRGILFDLDGTLLDTAPDMAGALNTQRSLYNLPPLPLETIRPYVGYGASALLKIGFNIQPTDPNYTKMVQDYLDLYESRLSEKTAFFPHVNDVLTQLDAVSLPWGIVTNKPSRFALRLFDEFGLANRAACLVCGDTVPTRKPDPGPILFGAAQMQLDTAFLVYVGDTDIDVIASQGANMRSLVALYGYIHEKDDPYTWRASGYLKTILDIIPWLESHQALSPA